MSSPVARFCLAALVAIALTACGDDANVNGGYDSADDAVPDSTAPQDVAADTPPVCAEGCAHGGLCVAPDVCDCAGTGFSGPGCVVDENECLGEGEGQNCDPQATCANTDGGFTCTCFDGFNGDGVTCVDIDECLVREEACGADAVCTNADGTFACACIPGFSGDGHTCVDVDECASNNGGCPLHATCANSAGGFSCPCDSGWSGAACDVPVCAPDCPAGTTCVAPGVCTPPAPTGVIVTPGDNALVVRWDAVSASPAVATYSVLAQPGGTTCDVAAPTQTCTLSALSNGTTYSVTATATSPAGTSLPSTPVDGTPAPPVTFDTLDYNGMTGYPLDFEACGCCNGTTTQQQMDALCHLAGRTSAITWTTQSLVIDNCYCWGGCSNFSWTSDCCSGQQTQTMVTSLTCE